MEVRGESLVVCVQDQTWVGRMRQQVPLSAETAPWFGSCFCQLLLTKSCFVYYYWWRKGEMPSTLVEVRGQLFVGWFCIYLYVSSKDQT